MTKRLEITLDDSTWERLNAARGFEPRASFVKRALEAALPSANGPRVPGLTEAIANALLDKAPVEKGSADSSTAELPPGDRFSTVGGSTPPRSAPSRRAYRCPVSRCEFTAGSAAAVCSLHGRKVVEG